MAATTLEVRRDDVEVARLHEHELEPLGQGGALLEVERFALTANNVTYAVLGDMLGYWAFFPADEPWGRVPAWGVARVVQSRADGLPEGTRVFGYMPMSTHMTVVASGVGPHGFSDATPHRAGLPPVYNSYELFDDGSRGSHRMVLRPLFGLAFNLDDQLAEELGPDVTVIVTSASSRTSLGIAYLAAQRGAKVVGLTSRRNLEFVESVGIHDRVLTYDRAGEVDSEPSVFVDVAGAPEPRAAVHGRLGDALVRSVIVGVTHRPDGSGGHDPLPGPEPAMFFAPDRIKQRIGDWGRAGYEQRLDAAWAPYLEWCDGWLTIEERDRSSALDTWHQVVDGSASPGTGHVVSLASG